MPIPRTVTETLYTVENGRTKDKSSTLYLKGVSILKGMTLAFKLFVLIKTHIWKSFNVLTPLNDAFYSETKKIKYFLDPPKKVGGI